MITPFHMSSTLTGAETPFTFGQVFVEGHVPVGSHVVADIPEFQCIPQSVWPDGSMKWGVMSGVTSMAAGVEKTINLSLGTPTGGADLTLADLQAANLTVSIGLTSPKDWAFDTAPQVVGKRLKMSNAFDILEPASCAITVNNGATSTGFNIVRDGTATTHVLTATVAGGTVDGYQTVKYLLSYRARRNIASITKAVRARVTVAEGWRVVLGTSKADSDGTGIPIIAVGQTITFSGIAGMTQLNGMTGTVTYIGNSDEPNPNKLWFEIDIDTTGFSDYVSGGVATKNAFNADDATDVAYVRPGAGLAWNGATGVTTYSPTNTTAQSGVSWSGADWLAPLEQWIAGPQMSYWRFRKDAGPDIHTTAWLEVRLYKNGKVNLKAKLENTRLLVKCPTAKNFNVALTINGVQKFNRNLELKAQGSDDLIFGTHLDYWNMPDPEVYPRHDAAYFYSTGMIPTAMNPTPVTATTVKSLPTTYIPQQRGNWQSTMGDAGFQSDIGIIPNHDALYFSCGDRKTYAGMMRNFMSTGRYRIHFRDDTTHRPIKFSDHTHLVMESIGAGMSAIGISATGAYTPIQAGGTLANPSSASFSSSHHPSMGYAPALVSAWYDCIEKMQFLTTVLYMKQVSGSSGRDGARCIIRPEVGANQKRGAAWFKRTLAQTLALLKPGSHLYDDLVNAVRENINHNHAKYIAVPHNEFGFWHLYTDYNSGDSTGMWASGFQQDFLTAALGQWLTLGLPMDSATLTKAEALFAWTANSVIGRLGDMGADEFPYMDCGQYEIPLSPNQLKKKDGDPRPAVVWDWTPETPTGPWWSSWGEIYDKRYLTGGSRVDNGLLRGGNFPTPGSYQSNLNIAIVAAVEHGVPGALTAYNRFIGATNFPQLEANLVAYPVYGVKPSSLVVVDPEDPPPPPPPPPPPDPDPEPDPEPEVPPVVVPAGPVKRTLVPSATYFGGRTIVGGRGMGIPGSEIDPASLLAPYVTDPKKEYRARVVEIPQGLVITPKGTYSYNAAANNTLLFDAYEDGVLINSFSLSLIGSNDIVKPIMDGVLVPQGVKISEFTVAWQDALDPDNQLDGYEISILGGPYMKLGKQLSYSYTWAKSGTPHAIAVRPYDKNGAPGEPITAIITTNSFPVATKRQVLINGLVSGDVEDIVQVAVFPRN